MALNKDDYRDILTGMRKALRQAGFGGIDERILTELQGSEGPYYDLIYYLKHLIDEVALGADEQLRNVLRRVRQTVETESGASVEGIEVHLTQEEAERYHTKNIVFGPDPELQEVVALLRSIIEDIQADRNNDNNPNMDFER